MKYLNYFLLLLLFSCTGNNTSKVQAQNVNITDKGNYFYVELNYENGATPYQIGQEYGAKIIQAVPNMETLVDSYISDVVASLGSYFTINYDSLILRTINIKTQLPQKYQDELDGLASQLTGGTTNGLGDGKVSKDELYMLNFMPDVATGYACSAMSVYGNKSETGKNITARLLDWYGGSSNQLAQLQAVVMFRNGSQSFCSVGYLGLMGALTAFNENKNFAALLYSDLGQPYSSLSKRPILFDMRAALEDQTTIIDIGNYLKDTARQYAFNHLIFLSDPALSYVLENDLTAQRKLRSDTSTLNAGITWGLNNTVASVNSFVLSGNHDNHTPYPKNYLRWNNFYSLLTSKDDSLSLKDVREIASYAQGNGPNNEPGDIYNTSTQQIILFEPETYNLNVFFRSKTCGLPIKPDFDTIVISFTTSGIQENKENDFFLVQAIPNPCNKSTKIMYSIKKPTAVEISLFDCTGRKVVEVTNKYNSAGIYEEFVSTDQLLNGIFFCVIKTEKTSRAIKIIVSK